MAGRLARLQEDVQATLLMAAEYARAHTVAVLIDLDVSVNGVDDDEGLAPLMLAAMNGHTDTVSELVGRHNANVEAVDRRGRTSLMLAASNGHTDAVNALAGTHKANVEAAYAFGNTALMLAAESGHTDTVNVLVGTHNANVEAGNWGMMWTPLMLAAMNGHKDTVSALHQHGASSAREMHVVKDTSRSSAGNLGKFGSLALSKGNAHLLDDSVPEEALTCTICQINTPKVRFHPCGHTTCRGCCRELQMRRQDCHLCRHPITDMQPLYL